MRLVAGMLLFTALCWAEPKVETGEINGAKFRIDVPEKWNGGLVMYCHGYSSSPGSYDDPKLAPQLEVFLEAGYAVAQSGYAAGGWAIQEAVVDTESLRRYFVKKYGPVKETYLTGHSMGGFLTMLILEQQPSTYDGGLPLCGPLASPLYFMSRGLFDGRVVFDYYFPGVLPDPSHVPSDFRNGKEVQARVLAALEAAPEKAAILRRRDGFQSDKDLAGVVSFVTNLARELQERAGGNPFDNRSTIYGGTPDDNALNAGVKRYAADPQAAAYLRTYYTPTGRLSKPMLAVHTSYDPLVPTWIPNTYTALVASTGSGANFVQEYVTHDGHCTIEPEEIGQAFRQLREWKANGVRPPGGLLKSR